MRRAPALLPLALLLAACVGATDARAHETGRHTGFVSTVSGVDPPLPGLVAQVLGGHERISLRNWTQSTVVVFDEAGGVIARLDPGESRAWPDPRIGWEGAAPVEDGLVRNWRIAGEADGAPFEIVGFLGYAEPGSLAPAPAGGLPRWALVLAGAGGAVVVLAALALPLRRREGEDGSDAVDATG